MVAFAVWFILCSQSVGGGVSLCPFCCLYSVAEFGDPYQLVHFVAYALIRRVFRLALSACARFLSCLGSIVRVWVALFARSLNCMPSFLGM